MRDHCRLDRPRRRATGMAAAVTVVTAAVAALATGCSGTAGAPPAAPAPTIQPVHVPAAQLARLPAATTYGTTPAAPPDPAPFAPETGIVLHPDATRAVYTRPGGPAVAALPATELGSPTWVPVVQSQPGWDRVLLPARPNRSTGWIYLKDKGLVTAYSAYRVEINLAAYRLTVLDGGRSLGPQQFGLSAGVAVWVSESRPHHNYADQCVCGWQYESRRGAGGYTCRFARDGEHFQFVWGGYGDGGQVAGTHVFGAL